MPTYNEFLLEKKSATEDFAPPTQVVKPAKDDKGYGLVNAAFKNQKSYFKPGIKSVNQDLDEHEY